MTDNIPHIEPIEEHAKAIGYVCVYWAALEHGVDALLQCLIPLEEGQIAESITVNADMREKLRMLKAVGFLRKPFDNWFGQLEHVINKIDNELRTERNRYIHDLWMGFSTVVRRTRRTALKKSQSRKPLTLTTYEETPIDASKIWELVNAISHAQVRLKILENEYRQRPASPSTPPIQSHSDRS